MDQRDLGEGLEPVIATFGLTELFLGGVILIPLVGNAAEHLVDSFALFHSQFHGFFRG